MSNIISAFDPSATPSGGGFDTMLGSHERGGRLVCVNDSPYTLIFRKQSGGEARMPAGIARLLDFGDHICSRVTWTIESALPNAAGLNSSVACESYEQGEEIPESYPYTLARFVNIPGGGTVSSIGVFDPTSPAFGARGDGVTDDWAAITACYAAAASFGARAIMLCPPLHYMHSKTFLFDSPQVDVIGWSSEEFTTMFEVVGSADPTWACIFGSTADIINVHMFGLTWKGRNDPSSTGGGVLFHAGASSIKQCRILQFGGDGIHVDSNNPASGQLFDILFDDVYVEQCGNAAKNTDGYYIGQGVYDSEFTRCIVGGWETPSARLGRYGFNNLGHNTKFTQCHAYFQQSHGFYCNMLGIGDSLPHLQIIGGEWETNTGDNIHLENLGRFTISDVNCYGGIANKDLVVVFGEEGRVLGGSFVSATSDKNVGVFNSNRVKFVGCDMEYANAAALDIETSNRVRVVACHFDSVGGVTLANSTNCGVTNSDFSQQGLVESGSCDHNTYSDNDFFTSTGAGYTLVGTHNVVHHSAGAFSDTKSGSVKVTAGSTSTTVTLSLGAAKRVTLSPTSDTLGARWWASGLSTAGFTAHLSGTVASDVTFDYRIVGFEEA